MKRIAAASIIAFLAVGVFAAEPAYDTLISHRGESKDAPENTLPAFKMAVDRGFGFECDIYISRMCSPGRATLLETGRDEWRKK